MLKITTALFVLISLVLSPLLNAQWLQMNGPVGGEVYYLHQISYNSFAGTGYKGLFRSTNNGASWTQTMNGITPLNIGAMTSNATNTFVGMNNNAVVYTSSDFGNTFTPTGTIAATTGIFAMSVIGPNIFAGTQSNGVFKSTDNGTSWNAVNNGLVGNALNIQASVVNGSTLYVGTYLGGVHKTTNNGTVWTTVNAGLTNLNVNALAFSGADLYAGTMGGVFKSTNNGGSWTAVNNGITNLSVWSVTAISNNIFAGTSAGVFRSTNAGVSWTAVNNGIINLSIRALQSYFSSGSTVVMAGTQGDGVFTSTNFGVSWQQAGLPAVSTNCLLESGSNIFAGTALMGISKTSDNGISWTQVNTGLPSNTYQTLLLKGTDIFTGSSNGVYMTTNNGVQWNNVSTGLTGNALNVNKLILSANNNIYAATLGGVFVTTNNGSNWSALNAGLPNLFVQTIIEKGSDLYAGLLNNGGVCKSTNGGLTWTQVNNGITQLYIYSFLNYGGNLYVGTRLGGIFVSTNNGTSWSSVNNGLPQKEVRSLLSSGSNIVAGLNGGGTFASTDNGLTWTDMNLGMGDLTVYCNLITHSYIFAGTGLTSVWRRPVNQVISVKTISNTIPDKYILYTNYPNPFNPSTIIRYAVPKSGLVKIIIYDALGKELAVLVNENHSPGTYEIMWNALNVKASYEISSGVYYCKIIAGEFSQTIRMTLLR